MRSQRLRKADAGAAETGARHRHRPLARGRSGARRARRLRGFKMTASKDSMGRPIVVVTGAGVVTSLGAGKDENWAKLTAGQSGIRGITRFATDNLKTRIAGTIDY